MVKTRVNENTGRGVAMVYSDSPRESEPYTYLEAQQPLQSYPTQSGGAIASVRSRGLPHQFRAEKREGQQGETPRGERFLSHTSRGIISEVVAPEGMDWDCA